MHIPSAGLTCALAFVAGWVAKALGAPLPWLLGALMVTASAGIANIRPLGHVLGFPSLIRTAFVPVIGVAIGAAFTPEVARQVQAWWPSLVALLAFVPLAHATGYLAARR
ncbi:MAG: AbrB family transcriptional regulator, partial [Pseudomonadota bacterium]